MRAISGQRTGKLLPGVATRLPSRNSKMLPSCSCTSGGRAAFAPGPPAGSAHSTRCPGGRLHSAGRPTTGALNPKQTSQNAAVLQLHQQRHSLQRRPPAACTAHAEPAAAHILQPVHERKSRHHQHFKTGRCIGGSGAAFATGPPARSAHSTCCPLHQLGLCRVHMDFRSICPAAINMVALYAYTLQPK